MRGQTSRSFLAIASAIIIAGVLVSASLFAFGGGEKTSTSTTTATATTTTTRTLSPSTSTTTETSVSTTTATQTQTQTQTQTVTSTTSSLQTETVTSDVGCPSGMICGNFTYSPTGGAVQVESVEATQAVAEYGSTNNGQQIVQFAVTFENAGTSGIYIPGGSTGVTTSIPKNSTVLEQLSSDKCAGTLSILELAPHESYTLYGPSCEAGIGYEQTSAGTIDVGFSFDWATSSSGTPYQADFSNSTTIAATFTFP